MKSIVKRTMQLLSWLDDNILLLLSAFLLVFIPLYPKIPLYSPIEQYIVRIRLEDIFVLLAASVWVVQWMRGKIKWLTPITVGMSWYFLGGLLSVLSAMFIIRTVPLEALHLGKTWLHYFRYIEYFFLFLITFSAIKTQKQVKVFLSLLAITLLSIVVYGFGQRFYYWPVYSTMNREFSKGIRLYLTEHARVQSTFAGHYDLGAYLVIVLPILLAMSFYYTKKWQKILLHTIHWMGLWLLIVSASRTSFVAYLVGVSLVILLYGLQQQTIWKKFRWFFTRQFIFGIILSLTIAQYGQDIFERFHQLLSANPSVLATYDQLNATRKDLVQYQEDLFADWFSDSVIISYLLNIAPEPEKPTNGLSTDEATQIILSSDTRPTPVKPSDVYLDIPDVVRVSTTSATGEETVTIVQQPRVFSDNALKHGLSLAIRLDSLWPQAIRGFYKNPLLGSGYATLNKDGTSRFTEADSTDNNFLRTLGETGLFGVITFYGSIMIAIGFGYLGLRSKDKFLMALAIGYIGASIGLLINAVYIDVYAASKVAFSYWTITGLFFALLTTDKKINAQLNRATRLLLGPVAVLFNDIQIKPSLKNYRLSVKKKASKKINTRKKK